MPGSSNAENLNIDPARSQDLAFVLLAVGKHFRTRNEAVRYVNIFRRNINVIEKLHLHKAAVTLRMMRWQPIVFIEIEGNNVPEREPFVAVQSDQFSVKFDRSRTSSESEDNRSVLVPPTTNQESDRNRYYANGSIGALKYRRWNTFM